MDDMLTIAALYGPPDPQTRPNPYAAFQAVSGAQLTPQGPTTTQDPTGYGNNSPNFYTQQLANMNNAGPASFYQPIPPGSGAGVSPYPSAFTPAYYLRVFNRGERSIRVSQGVLSTMGMPEFSSPREVDDSAVFEYPQATAGMKFPLMIELPSKSVLFRLVTLPTGPNQFVYYVPFENELVERGALKATIGKVTVYAESAPELALACIYLKQFLSPEDAQRIAQSPQVIQVQQAAAQIAKAQITPQQIAEQQAAAQQAAVQAAAAQQLAAQQAAAQQLFSQQPPVQPAVVQQAAAQQAAQQRAAEQRAAEQRAAEQRAAEQRATQQAYARQQAYAQQQQQVAQQAAAQAAAQHAAAQQHAAQQAAAKKEDSMIPSVLLLLGGVIATHFMNKYGE
jgi:hypothetical protein